jgi:hypothetical protein
MSVVNSHDRTIPTYVQFESKKVVVHAPFTAPIHIMTTGSGIVCFAECFLNSTSPQIYRYSLPAQKNSFPPSVLSSRHQSFLFPPITCHHISSSTTTSSFLISINSLNHSSIPPPSVSITTLLHDGQGEAESQQKFVCMQILRFRFSPLG